MKGKFVGLRDPESGRTLDLYTRNGEPRPLPYGVPAEIKVFGRTFRVYAHTWIYNARKESSRLRGVVCHDFNAIFIDPQQSRYDFMQTLLHELAHAYIRDDKFRCKDMAEISYSLEEAMCDLFAHAFLDLQSTVFPKP